MEKGRGGEKGKEVIAGESGSTISHRMIRR